MPEKEFLILYKEKRNLKSIREAKERFDDLWEALFGALAKDEKVIIKDWGIFEVKIQKPKRIFNFSTGEIVDTEEKKVIKFKPREKLLKKVNNLEIGEEYEH